MAEQRNGPPREQTTHSLLLHLFPAREAQRLLLKFQQLHCILEIKLEDLRLTAAEMG